MAITKEIFGRTSKDEVVTKWTMTNKCGNSVSILDMGCIIHSIVIEKDHKKRDVVMGFDSPEGYEKAGGFIGATIGRCANRIKDGKFELDGKIYQLPCNDGNNHLHGGKEGLHGKIWNCIPDTEKNRLILNYMSPDGEGGYPGNLSVIITLTWNEDNELIFKTVATCDQTTIFNLTNHSYFDLSGEFTEETACNQFFWTNANGYMPVDEKGFVTGELKHVQNTAFDFSTYKTFNEELLKENLQLKAVGGFDHNLSFENEKTQKAVLKAHDYSMSMEVETDSLGFQLYSGNYLRKSIGKDGKKYDRRSGVCIEPQYFPNSINLSQFVSPILHKGEVREQTTIYRFLA